MRDSDFSPRATRTATALGLIALVLWAGWWIRSRLDGRLAGARYTWVPALDFLGGDFVVHIDHTARVWASGDDPYRAGDEVCSIFPYPPMIPRLFGWVAAMPTAAARDVWMACLSGLLAIGAISANRSRSRFGLARLPATVAIAAIVFSTPALFVIERAQCDGLVIAFLIGSSALLRKRTAPAEIAAGALIALAAWIKYYPGLALIGLVAMRRWRAVGACCAVGLALGGYDFRGVMRSLENCRVVVAQFAPGRTWVLTPDHSLSYGWKSLWRGTILKPLGRIPGTVAAMLVLGPIVAMVGRRVLTIPRDLAPRIALPLLTWLVAVATFFPPIANDYNLIFLPLAALAVYSPRDRPIVHMLAAYLVLWWQPLHLPITGGLLLGCKVAGAWGVGLSLIARARDLAAAPAYPGPHVARAAHPSKSNMEART